MRNERKKLLFLTNFSEACFQAIPTLGEWIDQEQGELTLVHVHGHGKNAEAKAGKNLKSFFAEADRYANCQRVLLEGEPEQVLVDFCLHERPEMVFAPATEPSGLPRLLKTSMRASLMRRAGVRIWTRGRRSGTGLPRRAVENVAYALSGQNSWPEEVLMAARTALRHGARFHLLNLTPIQDVQDGTLASEIRVGNPNVSLDELQFVIQHLPVPVEVHTAAGNEFRELPRLLKELAVDIAFVGERHSMRRGLFGYSLNPDLDRLGCEAVCFPHLPAPGLAKEDRILSGSLAPRPMYIR